MPSGALVPSVASEIIQYSPISIDEYVAPDYFDARPFASMCPTGSEPLSESRGRVGSKASCTWEQRWKTVERACRTFKPLAEILTLVGFVSGKKINTSVEWTE